MKYLLHNTVLVVSLFVLFALPFASFAFIQYDEKPSYTPAVLGVKKVVVNEAKVVDQIEYDVSLGDTTIQRLYNVLPEEYLGKDYQVVLSVPNEAKELGVRADLVKEESGTDLIISTPFDFNNEEYPEMRLILIVLK